MMEQILDYSPWCIVTISANRQYVTIETLEHEDNTYPTAQKHLWMVESTKQLLNVMKAVFERPTTITYGNITVIKTNQPNMVQQWTQTRGTNQ